MVKDILEIEQWKSLWFGLKNKLCEMVRDEKNSIKTSGYVEILRLMSKMDGGAK